MSGFAQAVAHGSAKARGRRQGAEDDRTSLGVERAQACVEAAGKLVKRGPAAPGKDFNGGQSHGSKLVGQHDADALARVLGRDCGEPSRQSFERIIH